MEEEFLLLCRDSLVPVPRAGPVLDRAARTAADHRFELQHELWNSEVESATGVCADLAQLRDDLVRGRAALAAAAREEGLRLVSVGHPVLGSGPAAPSPEEHYRPVRELYSGAVRDQEVCGCHVHVGVPDRDTGVAVLNHLTPWLPTLLAVTANSPYRFGGDTGFHSWRMMVHTRLPASGIPPWFASVADYDADLARLKECGLLPTEHGGMWLARLSDHLPTVEVRVGDAAATVDEAVLYAALVRGLVRTALAELARGREARRLSDVVLGEALWSAARHGLTGQAVEPWTGARIDAPFMARRLVRHVEPELAATGDLATVEALFNTVLTRGTGAVRQRRRGRAHGPRQVLAALIAETSTGTARVGADDHTRATAP